MILVNYWDSSLTTLPILKDGSAGPSIFQLTSERSRKTHADVKTHVDHASNTLDSIKERQMDPHFHALVLDPFLGAVAYVPDLGMDVIRQYLYVSVTCDQNVIQTKCSNMIGTIQKKVR